MTTYYWHSIGSKFGDGDPSRKQQWWSYLITAGEISAGFENDPSKGKQVLDQYNAGDVIIAFAPGFGAVGCGIVENPSSYVRVRAGRLKDVLGGIHLHRLSVTWKAVIPLLSNAIPVAVVRDRFGIYHPIRTSVRITDQEQAKHLTEYIHEVGEELI